MGFNYAKFEEDLFQEVMKHMETLLDYKYNEQEWGIVERFDGLSKELEKEYERICAENEDDCEARKAHNDKIFACCKNVMKQFKQTALYKEFDSLSLNATIWEYLSDEEMLQTYEEINGKENAAEYRKSLFGE